MYAFRVRRFHQRLHARDADEPTADLDGRSRDFQRLSHEVLSAQRHALERLRRAGEISDQVTRRVEHDLDLEQARLEPGTAA